MLATTRNATMTAIAVLALLLTVVLGAAPSHAASTDPFVDVQLLVDGEEGNGFLLVSGVLPPEVSLPASLTLPIPAGASVWWAGELTGLGADADITRDVTFSEGEGGQVVTFSLETTRAGQYDALYLPTQASGDEREAELEWVQSSPASQVFFSVVLPAGAAEIEFDPTPVSGPARNLAGESLYILPSVEAPSLGDKIDIRVAYTPGHLLTGRDSESVTPVLLILGAIAVILVGAVVVIMRRQRGVLASDEDDPTEPLGP